MNENKQNNLTAIASAWRFVAGLRQKGFPDVGAIAMVYPLSKAQLSTTAARSQAR
jgi:hypothetical protein